MKRLASLTGLRQKISIVRSGSSNPENKDNQVAGNYNTARENENKDSKQAEKPGDQRPPRFSLNKFTKNIKNRLTGQQTPTTGEVQAPRTSSTKGIEIKKVISEQGNKKKENDTSAECSPGILFTSRQEEQVDQKKLFIKVQFMERENKNFQKKLSQQEKINQNDQETIKKLEQVIQDLLQKNREAEENQSSDIQSSEVNPQKIIINQLEKKVQLLQQQILAADKERSDMSAEFLIQAQLQEEKKEEVNDREQELIDEISELRDNIDRKEYLLQYNEQKYYQYELVLRDLILNPSTDEPVKDQLREKIESQQLFVPKDERKVSNLVLTNREQQSLIDILKIENRKLQQQVEEITQKGKLVLQVLKQQSEDPKFKSQSENNHDISAFNFLSQTMEALSIFQNKEVINYRNIKVQAEKSDDKRGFDKMVKSEKNLEKLNQKVQFLKEELIKLREENQQLKAANENHIIINARLNQALKKQVVGSKKEKKEKKIEQVEVSAQRDHIEGTGGSQSLQQKEVEENFCGDLSSIVIQPMEEDQIAGGGQFTDFLQDDSVQFQKKL